MALRTDTNNSLKMVPLKFPLDFKTVSPLLKFIPEFVIDNVVEHILLAKRFCPQHLEEQVGHEAEALYTVVRMINLRIGADYLGLWFNNNFHWSALSQVQNDIKALYPVVKMMLTPPWSINLALVLTILVYGSIPTSTAVLLRQVQNDIKALYPVVRMMLPPPGQSTKH